MPHLGTLAVNFISTPNLTADHFCKLNVSMEKASPVERAKRLRHSRALSRSVPVRLDENLSDTDSDWDEFKTHSMGALPCGSIIALDHNGFPFHWAYAMEMYFAMYTLGYVLI
jgi:hypothetical protein